MKFYRINAEHLSEWTDGWNDVITDTELERLAHEWNVPVSELLGDLTEIEQTPKFYMVETARGDDFITELKATNIDDARKESAYYTSHLTDRERAEQTAYIVSPAADWDRFNETIFERAEYTEQI